jgi:hypothetical protein
MYENLFENFSYHKEIESDPVLLDVLESTIVHLIPTPDSEIVFTDDRAPIEQLTDSIAIRFILQGSLEVLQ